MRKLESLQVGDAPAAPTFELYYGDLTALPADMFADILVVSAFPDNYRPFKRTLVRALSDKGRQRLTKI